jgi:plastocyanin
MKSFMAMAVVIAGLTGCASPEPAAPGVPVAGTILYKGERRASKVLSMEAEEGCQKLHATPVTEEKIVVSAEGSLANAFVYIKKGLENRRFPPATEAVVLEQRGCQFVPRVLALRTGQTLAVKNADPVSHNVHPTPQANRDWNQQQPPGAPDLQRKFAAPEVMIPVKCNVHNWMRSYIGVMEHPYFAVTKADGKFSWPDLPAGQYTLAVWHESLGELTQELTVAPGKPAAVTLEFRD